MAYESSYRPTRTVYDDELTHYGVKGMKWGRRKSPTAYGGSITKSGKYRASNGVVIGRSKSKGVAIGRRLSVTAGGRALAAIGSTGLSAKQKAQMKKEQAALKEYYKVGGDKMLKRTSVEGGSYAKPEHKAKATKAKKVAKIGAAVAGTALAAYGAYKVSKVLKDKAASKSYATGKAAMERWMTVADERGRAGDWKGNVVAWETARQLGAKTDARTDKVRGSTVEAVKYLYKTRRR